MAYEKKGYNPKSLANLTKGSQLQKLMHTDTRSRELAGNILDEVVDYNGVMMTNREAILRQQLAQAIRGDLRSCQFLIELAGRNEDTAKNIETATPDPLEALYAKMLSRTADDRRRKISQ